MDKLEKTDDAFGELPENLIHFPPENTNEDRGTDADSGNQNLAYKQFTRCTR